MRSVRVARRTLRGALLISAVLISAVLMAAPSTRAQGAPVKRVTVTGLAFDSLHGVPLADAFVAIAERSRSTTSDAKGKFTFDTLPPGTYTFAMQHAVFDSLGLSGATTRVVITDGRAPVTLAVPSFPTLWRAVCGDIPVPTKDSGLVYGSVRDAKAQKAVAQASVEVSWLDLVNLGTNKATGGVTQRRWRNETQADARGGYAVCGVPLNTQLRVRASYLTNVTGSIDLAGSADQVRRRDLVIAGTLAADSALRGAVTGTITNPAGRPIAGVRVILDDVSESRSDSAGRFMLRSVPTGSRQLDFAAIGMTPFSASVDVLSGDTAFVTATLRTVTNLEAMRTIASGSMSRSAKAFEERRRLGFGSVLDSTTIARRATLSAAFAGIPGVIVENKSANGRRFNLFVQSTGTGPCLATLLIDGTQQLDSEFLNTMRPSEIAAIEVFQQRLTVPAELMRTDPKCGVIAVWTKNAFRR